MKKTSVIYQNGQHQWIAVVHKPERPNDLGAINEYLITDGTTALLTYPGGSEICSLAFAAIAKRSGPTEINGKFTTHQAPDGTSSLTMKPDFNQELNCHLTCLWRSFVPNFCIAEEMFIELTDENLPITVGKLKLQIVPAHYLHSFGSFQLYDETAGIFFSGGIGAAILPQQLNGLFVKDFDRHIRYAEDFYRRWMWWPNAKRRWCERAASMEIDMLCPQHGAIYQGSDVERFINWFSELKVRSQPARRMESKLQYRIAWMDLASIFEVGGSSGFIPYQPMDATT
jgi:flavorubredoxin